MATTKRPRQSPRRPQAAPALQQIGDDIPQGGALVARLLVAPDGGAIVVLFDMVAGAEVARAPLPEPTLEALDVAVASLRRPEPRVLPSPAPAAQADEAVAHSGTVVGVAVLPVQVRVRIARGLPGFSISGMADAAVRESRTRVRAALEQSGFPFPMRVVEVALDPLDVPKSGVGLDLAVALATLAAMGEIPAEALRGWLFLGELSLSGGVRGMRGAYPLVASAASQGLRGVILAVDNATEGAHAAPPGVEVLCADTLNEVVAFLRGGALRPARSYPPRDPSIHAAPTYVDLSDIRGADEAKWAMQVAAAGGHNVLLVGLPGAGKTLLARSLLGILPPLTFAESAEVATVYSAAGFGFFAGRPFRAPHHTASAVGLAGGGDPPRPGELSLATNGVLFLDELPEFARESLEALREPLEAGTVTVYRTRHRTTMPARFQLVAAMAPCPCGWAGDPSDRCECSRERVARYRARVAGPLLNAFDIFVTLPSVPPNLAAPPGPPTSANVRAYVEMARTAEARRGLGLNAHLSLTETARIDSDAAAGRRVASLGLAPRDALRVRKVARTVADLAGRAVVSAEDVDAAARLAMPLIKRP